MAGHSIELGVKINGDSRGAQAAVSDVDRELKGLVRAEGKIALLESAEAQAQALASKAEAARQRVQQLETALSEALTFEADTSTIKRLTGELSSAEKEAGRLSGAIEKNRSVLVGLRLAAQQAGVNLARLADEKVRIDEARRAAEGLSSAFRTLGVRPLREVIAETGRLKAALDTVRNSGLQFDDKERAAAVFTQRLAALRREVSGLPAATEQAGRGLGQMAGQADSVGAALGAAAHKALAWTGALAGLHGVSSVAGDIVKTGAAFETLEARLTSLPGSTEAAREAMGNIKELAITTPFEVTALADSFTKLTAFGLQPSMQQMRALADTAATLGGGTEALTGVTIALGQAWAKGKPQGDEILQMAERGVPVWDVLATATGKSTAELQKMSEAGELGRGAILKLIDALGKMNAGASEKLMSTFSGAVSNAKDALAEFYDMIARAGVLDFLTAQVQDLLAEFARMKETGELDAAAKRMADAFVAVGEGVRSAIEAINTLSGVIVRGAEVFVAWRLAGMSLIPVLGGVGTAAGATAVQATALGAASEKAAFGMRAMAAAGRLIKGLTLVGLIEGAVSLVRGTEIFGRTEARYLGDLPCVTG
ncbi:MAG: tape measure protein [Dechloromonas sp.]|jgi:tape measure domain-containing protein|nr:tape measure protein [Dechloromonas sp.]